ncbi:hypothetical protein PanWU01x14_170940 [Parasponia andersonii]|uniref:Uncharacterized protein n=1 Tax=Parasponia andersonii TaxID=3476 RepID=A0A2P5CA33_PARAD|nr:hypothetical protein PanWU01x14_170940 [Parasponia andersonii]
MVNFDLPRVPKAALGPNIKDELTIEKRMRSCSKMIGISGTNTRTGDFAVKKIKGSGDDIMEGSPILHHTCF